MSTGWRDVLAAEVKRRLPRGGERLREERPDGVRIVFRYGWRRYMVTEADYVGVLSVDLLATRVARVLACPPKQPPSDFALPPRTPPEAKEAIEERVRAELDRGGQPTIVPPNPMTVWIECEKCGAAWRQMDVDACPVCALTELRRAIEDELRWARQKETHAEGAVASSASGLARRLKGALERTSALK